MFSLMCEIYPNNLYSLSFFQSQIMPSAKLKSIPLPFAIFILLVNVLYNPTVAHEKHSYLISDIESTANRATIKLYISI